MAELALAALIRAWNTALVSLLILAVAQELRPYWDVVVFVRALRAGLPATSF